MVSAFDLVEIDSIAGLKIVFLSELEPRPSASIGDIRNIVEVNDKDSDPTYDGHDPEKISTLYPEMRQFSAPNVSLDETWRIFFIFSVNECKNGSSWINDDLSDALENICSLELLNVPYKTLCRSIFDTDPAAMFLALYRCLEAIYAYSSAQKMVSALESDITWSDMATILENELGYYPREDRSIEELMGHVAVDSINLLFKSIAEVDLEKNILEKQKKAGRRIYKLRNSLVHYRPALQGIDYNKIDWNLLCKALAVMIKDIYIKLFPV